MTGAEIWRPIPGWEGLYEASSFGRIRSCSRLDGRGRRLRTRILKLTSIGDGGYPRVDLHRHDGGRLCRVNRLVCLSFHGEPPPGKPWALHRDGDPRNNRPGNLYWGDLADNVADARRHGTYSPPPRLRGARNGSAKLTEAKVAEIHDLLRAGEMTQNEIAELYGAHPSTVSAIKRGKVWAHLQAGGQL